MRRVSEELGEQPAEGIYWDLTTVVLVTLVTVLIAWITSELWLPHGGHR